MANREDKIQNSIYAGIVQPDGKYVCATCIGTKPGLGKGLPVFKSSATKAMKCRVCKKSLDRFWKE
jgi:hypothetical protein